MRTIGKLAEIVTGDKKISKYRSGPMLVDFFNEFGSNDRYGSGFPTRITYAKDSLAKINGKIELLKAVEAMFDPLEFEGLNYDEALDYIRPYLNADGIDLRVISGRCKAHATSQDIISLDAHIDILDRQYIQRNIEKCDSKISTGDFEGAITNARTLLEEVLLEMKKTLTGAHFDNDGNLPKLYKDTSKLLNLDPGQQKLNEAFKQIMTGFVSIVNGLSALRNEMSDAHATTYKPSKHHAVLAVNSAKTLTLFIFDTFEHQKSVSKITVPKA